MESVYAELKSQDAKSVIRIYVLGYQFPDILDGWDADWYVVRLEVKLPSFTYQLTDPALCGRELEILYKELQEFSALKSLSASLDPMEPYIELELKFDSKKSVDVSGTVLDVTENGRGELRFEFKTDLPSVDVFIKEVQTILKLFPPRRTD